MRGVVSSLAASCVQAAEPHSRIDTTRGAACIPSLRMTLNRRRSFLFYAAAALPFRANLALIPSPRAGADYAHIIEGPCRDRCAACGHSPCRACEPSRLGRLQGEQPRSEHCRLHPHHRRQRRKGERFRYRPPFPRARLSDRAIADYHEAIRLDLKYADAYYGRGLTYRNKGDLERAIADYSEAIRLDPKLAAAYNNRGTAYRDQHDLDRAIADFNEAIRLAPEVEAVYPDTIIRRLAHFNRGGAYAEKGDPDRGIADFNEAIRLDPKSADAYYRRAATYVAKHDIARAVADLSEVIRLAPEVASVRHERGKLYQVQRDYAHAIADYTEAIRLDPKFAAAYNDRGTRTASRAI